MHFRKKRAETFKTAFLPSEKLRRNLRRDISKILVRVDVVRHNRHFLIEGIPVHQSFNYQYSKPILKSNRIQLFHLNIIIWNFFLKNVKIFLLNSQNCASSPLFFWSNCHKLDHSQCHVYMSFRLFGRMSRQR